VTPGGARPPPIRAVEATPEQVRGVVVFRAPLMAIAPLGSVPVR
jgi:hypothetical protein